MKCCALLGAVMLATSACDVRTQNLADADSTRLRVGTCSLTVGIADTPGRRATGLSHTTTLHGDGLLLRWPRRGLHAIWMAGMRYPLDLAWVDGDDVVRAVLSDVPPCLSDPCPIYAPPKAANSVAVLETGAGRLAACEVRTGRAISLTSAERNAR